MVENGDDRVGVAGEGGRERKGLGAELEKTGGRWGCGAFTCQFMQMSTYHLRSRCYRPPVTTDNVFDEKKGFPQFCVVDDGSCRTDTIQGRFPPFSLEQKFALKGQLPLFICPISFFSIKALVGIRWEVSARSLQEAERAP